MKKKDEEEKNKRMKEKRESSRATKKKLFYAFHTFFSLLSWFPSRSHVEVYHKLSTTCKRSRSIVFNIVNISHRV